MATCLRLRLSYWWIRVLNSGSASSPGRPLDDRSADRGRASNPHTAAAGQEDEVAAKPLCPGMDESRRECNCDEGPRRFGGPHPTCQWVRECRTRPDRGRPTTMPWWQERYGHPKKLNRDWCTPPDVPNQLCTLKHVHRSMHCCFVWFFYLSLKGFLAPPWRPLTLPSPPQFCLSIHPELLHWQNTTPKNNLTHFFFGLMHVTPVILHQFRMHEHDTF